MRTLRIPVALAVSVGALVSVSTSFAAENTTTSSPPKSTTTTTSAPYACPDTGDRVVTSRPNSGLLETGAGMFVLSYGASVAASVISDRDADRRLLIPVAGPWMDLADRGCSLTTPCGEGEGFAKVLLVTSGITQGASALMMVGSLLVPEVKVERRDSTASVRIVPMSFRGGAGVGAVGRF